jgi:hypothetical protein
VNPLTGGGGAASIGGKNAHGRGVAYEIKIDIRRDKSRAVFATPAFLFLAAEITAVTVNRKIRQ